MFVCRAAENRKAPAGPAPTDAETIELFKTFAAASGRYKIEGNNKLIFHYDVSASQSTTGKDRSFQLEIAGQTLTVTAEPFRSSRDGSDVVVIVTYERLE